MAGGSGMVAEARRRSPKEAKYWAKCHCRSWSWLRALEAFQQSQSGYQGDCADRGNDQAAEEPAADRHPNGSEEKSAEQGTDDANNKVANEAVVARPHDLPGKPSSRQADQNEPDDIHVQRALVALELRAGFPHGLLQFVPSDLSAVP